VSSISRAEQFVTHSLMQQQPSVYRYATTMTFIGYITIIYNATRVLRRSDRNCPELYIYRR